MIGKKKRRKLPQKNMKIKKDNHGKKLYFQLLVKAFEEHSVVLFEIAIYKKNLEQKVGLTVHTCRRHKQNHYKSLKITLNFQKDII